MLSTVRSLTKFGRVSSNATPVLSSWNSKFSTSTATRSSAEDGEPDFLEMVKVFADNAHSIALDKLLSAKPAPGKRQEEAAVREKHIKGKILSQNLFLIFGYFLT